MPSAKTDTATPVLCPKCQSRLVSENEATPWCARCEWNLDHFPAPQGLNWVLRWLYVRERRLGFTSGTGLVRELATGRARPTLRLGTAVLVAVSAVLLLLPLALLAGGVWLIAASGGFGTQIILGLLLIAAAYWLRPRVDRLKDLKHDTYPLSAERQPELFALIARTAAAVGAPMPDHVALSDEWNAWVARAGVRGHRVLVLGIPALVALSPQQTVALLAHELGHLGNADPRRRLLTRPACTMFAVLARALRPPRKDAWELRVGGILAVVLAAWQVLGGALCRVLYSAHIGMNLLAERTHRRAEALADLGAAGAAGTAATLELVADMAMWPVIAPVVDGRTAPGAAQARWREGLAQARERNAERAPRLLQLSNRTDASLFSSHPAPGRRHDLLKAAPFQQAAVVVTPEQALRLDAELNPYVEALRGELAKRQRDFELL
ncbi:M48 family metallopeptidase [Catellatospora sp. KI3]|uniref:M48 family metallopeptidase n=1 Tax=Catellatospora sp. KI3 TaxID=3041620 RepID=UPI00248256D9|nr:M48 family metallopeptidase [Catellatospora sp. KI3]MDI1465502.1 M48 family metallopeptidase [Catellatospora sp. KI3]